MKKLHIDSNKYIIYLSTVVFFVVIIYIFINIKNWTIAIYTFINNSITYNNKIDNKQLEIDALNIKIGQLENNINSEIKLLPLQYIISDNNIYNMILLRNNTSEIVLYENDIVFMGNNIPIGAVSKIDNNLIYVKLFSNKDFMYDAMVSRVEYDKTNNTVAKDITNDNDYIEIKLTGDGLYSATFQLDSNIKVNMGDEIYLKHNKYPIGKITYSKELDKENNNKYYVDLYYKNNYNKDFYVIK